MKSLTLVNDASILILGDVMLDKYWFTETNRVSPEAPVPVVKYQQTTTIAGGAANVALNINALGGHSAIIGAMGKDDAAENLNAILTQAQVDANLIAIDDYPTTTKLRILSRNQQLLRVDDETHMPDSAHDKLLSAFSIYLDEHTPAYIVLSDYAKGVLAKAQAFIQVANRHNIPVLVDPKNADFSLYAGAFLVKPNEQEFKLAVGEYTSDDELVSKAQILLETHNIQALLITRSEKGMILIQQGTPPVSLPTQSQDVYDVTGAGDTVIATLATTLASDYPLSDAIKYANIAAGIVIGKIGTATATTDEVNQVIHASSDVPEVLDEASLIHHVKRAKAQGKTVVMTNGCFDILHPGHLAYLAEAKTLGDYLIVAVNADESVKKLKGETRPINSLADRMTMLANLKQVDWVVPFSEETPENLICDVLPDILVKGGDYAPEEIAGYDCVKHAGGDVRVLSFVDNHSTSKIIEKIRSQD